ncbi:MAG: phosphotransferase [Candidatus Binatia bacterium]|nr:phosphotransferase [Candidatus Binatia bacterium]
MPNLPTPETIDAAWLTERLRDAGHATATVRGLTKQRIGTGQVGMCIRYELDLEGADASTPRTLVGKFASDDPTSRQTGILLKNYIKEVSFYRELVSRLSISTPRCYYADIEGDGPDFVLLLEDMAPAEQGDQLAGCSPEIAKAAVLELVGLHAPSWKDETLRGPEWLGEPSDMTIQMGRMLYKTNLPGFLERYGARLAPDEVAIIEAVAESQGPPFQLLRDPWSLVHIDYRLDNLLIDAAQTPPRISVVDWQSVALGSPLSDVAYFLGAGLLAEDRRPVEEEIVRAYHGALGDAGVSGYAWEDCWQDYRRGTFSGFAVTIIASMLVGQTERGDEMFVAMASRHARHAIDMGAGELLG